MTRRIYQNQITTVEAGVFDQLTSLGFLCVCPRPAPPALLFRPLPLANVELVPLAVALQATDE